MTPVEQTIIGEHGNCFAACLASLMEIPIEQVMCAQEAHESGKSWTQELSRWLAPFGLSYIEVKPEGIDYVWLSRCGYHMIGGDSPRGTVGGHSVIGLNGKIYFDPHPTRAGLTKITDYGFLVKTWHEAISQSDIDAVQKAILNAKADMKEWRDKSKVTPEQMHRKMTI